MVYFDTPFKQINYIKMESVDNCGNLDCEEMEIKYSKRKNTLNLFTTGSSNIIVLLITEFDKKDTCYAYHIKTTHKDTHKDTLPDNFDSNFDSIANGFTKLLKSGMGEEIQDQDHIVPIKNQNIFAKIKRKG